MMVRCGALLLLTVLSARAQTTSPAAVLHPGVERALPVCGQPCRLTAELVPAEGSECPATVEVEFRIEAVGGEAAETHRVTADRAPDQPGPAAAFTWIPSRTGPHRISASTTLGDHSLAGAPVEAFVTSRRLHFNYWGCAPEQRYVTSVMDNSKEGDTPARWLRRGVLPLVWKGGVWLRQQPGFELPGPIAANWCEVLPGRVGIMIDEFGAGGEVDEQLGEALCLTRQQAPGLFLAPYCLGIGGEKMTAGFGLADLVLVETYTSDWRGDRVILGRWGSLAAAGLAAKSIAVLGVGGDWTTTEGELRRLFRMVRASCPEMPGIGFFPVVPPRLATAVDAAIEDYFLRPVLKGVVQGRALVIRNLGETPALEVQVVFQSAAGEPAQAGATVPRLDPWSTCEVPLPPGATGAALPEAPGRYTVLDYRPPLEAPLPDSAARAAAQAFRQQVLAGRQVDALARASELRLERSDTRHADPGYHDNPRLASIPLPPVAAGPVALSFDLRLGRAWFYGTNSVSLAGKGALALTWAHSDHDAGLGGDQPRPELSFTGADGYTVREVPAFGFSQDRTYRVLLAYDGRAAARVQVSDEQEALLWDSGPVPAEGGFECRELRFEVGAFKSSEVRVDAATGEVFLRGVSGGPLPSPYVLESTLTNLRLVTEDGPRR
jgi:hypothetical protein